MKIKWKWSYYSITQLALLVMVIVAVFFGSNCGAFVAAWMVVAYIEFRFGRVLDLALKAAKERDPRN